MKVRREKARPTPRIGQIALLVAAMALAGTGRAQLPLQQVGSGFDIIGFIQSATLDSPGDLLAGGTVLVNGHQIVIPRNTILQMPAATLTWQELFSMAPPPYGPTQTGLALFDQPAPLTTTEIHVQGNRIGDTYIAGLVFISQQSVNSGQGFVNFIDYANGELRIGGKINDPSTGTRVKINDPLGRFAPAFTLDQRFSIDEDNPTVRAQTGFPMCFPHVNPAVGDDPLCPKANRPRDPLTGQVQTIFTMPAPGGPVTLPNAMYAAPFQVGDFVTFAGTLMKDGAQPTAGPFPTTGPSSTYIAAHTIVANLGIFTAPGTTPVYVGIDVAILGTGGLPIAGIAQEATVRTRFEGFSTDTTRGIQLWGIDVDACTASTSDRNWGFVNVDIGPPTGMVKGRWRFRPPTNLVLMPPAGVFLPATRSVRAVASGAWGPLQPIISGNGIQTGQYNAPIFDFLFPENLAVGGTPVPYDFTEFPFLANGTFGFAGVNVGQLQPWPGASAPAPLCGPPPNATPPTANAGLDQTTTSGNNVTLDASASKDPNGLAIAWTWTQTGGPTVTLNSFFAEKPSFTAPPVPAPATSVVLTFQLVVTNTLGMPSTPDFVNVTVSTPAAPKAPSSNAGANQTVASGSVVQLNGTGSADPNTPPLTLSYAWTQTGLGGFPAVTLSSAAAATPTFKAPLVTGNKAVTLTFQLVVTNSAGLSSGTSSVNITVNPVVAPTANAGSNLSILVGRLVTLDGSLSSDPNGLPLTYSWTVAKQPGGSKITLSNPTSVRPTFTPQVAGAYVLNLVVADSLLKSQVASVTVGASTTPDKVTITAVTYQTGSQRLTVNATSSITDGTAILYLVGYGVGGTDIVMTSLGGGLYTIVLTGIPLPGTPLTVSSSAGGSASSFVTKVTP